MIRLQRVTFLALHDYLGLTTELTHPDNSSQSTPVLYRSHSNGSRPSKTAQARSTARSEAKASIPRKSPEKSTQINHDSNEKESPPGTKSVIDLSSISPSFDEHISKNVSTTVDSTVENDPTESPTNMEPTSFNAKSVQKRSASHSCQRSVSLLDSHPLKPDFEEAAARARVKNSLDTTFFEKHKISYPNVSNHRNSMSSVSRQRTTLYDVTVAIFIHGFISVNHS